ncbi:hypothetical protein BJV78DRAFT_433486 [Lactifluus subvellereus]|nr:hypothetical protein BJV78DRAFT_433486 [Lactifluus subvellereus]
MGAGALMRYRSPIHMQLECTPVQRRGITTRTSVDDEDETAVGWVGGSTQLTSGNGCPDHTSVKQVFVSLLLKVTESYDLLYSKFEKKKKKTSRNLVPPMKELGIYHDVGTREGGCVCAASLPSGARTGVQGISEPQTVNFSCTTFIWPLRAGFT